MNFLQNLPQIDGYQFDSHAELLFSPVLGKTVLQQTLAVPGGGCIWYQKTSGNCCPFCAFPGLTNDITGGTLLKPKQFSAMLEYAKKDCSNPAILQVFNGGNFFVESEIPPDFRREVYQYAADNPHVQIVMVESKPQYITGAVLDEAVSILGDKARLMVGIGWESSDNNLRNKVLKKGMSQKEFETSVKLMHQFKVLSFAYVFLKAPGLVEGDALKDALATCQDLYKLNIDQMALSCAFVQRGTPLEEKYLNYQKSNVEGVDSFRPPWIWSILSMIEQAHSHNWPLSVGGLNDTPPPLAIAQNCEQCTEQCLRGLNDYRKTGDFADVSSLYCDNCFDSYRSRTGFET